jgi:hypothetical protein
MTKAMKVEGSLHVVCQCDKCKAQLAPVQELVEKFCDANCTWSDHHPDCKLAQRTCDKLPQPQLEQP